MTTYTDWARTRGCFWALLARWPVDVYLKRSPLRLYLQEGDSLSFRGPLGVRPGRTANSMALSLAWALASLFVEFSLPPQFDLDQ